MRIDELLNKIRWDPRLKSKFFRVTYIHRGAERGTLDITYERIRGIFKSFFTYLNDAEEEIVIPYHRIVKITDDSCNQVIYRKK